MKSVSLLGSTGSIGTQTLDVIRKNNDIKVVALAAGTRVKELAEQTREFKPQLVSVGTPEKAKELKVLLSDMDVKIVYGMEGLIEAATIDEADIVVTAVVGMMGIEPTIAAINAHKDIALANKETLVTAGHIIINLAKEKNVSIYPVDSEHSAIFQCLNGENRGQIDKILLTASGGPFRGKTRKELENVTLADALKGADIFVGVSAPNIVTPEMVASMNKDAILFAMANPVPEIMPDIAKAAGAKVVGTGRSDFPNQVNNVVAFPGIFKGALEGRATAITEDMKLATAKAIAGLVPDEELNENNILPEAFDPRVADVVSRAVKELI